MLEEAERILREISAGVPFESGDVNRDRIRSVSDVVALRRIILLGGGANAYVLADVDQSGDITVADVVQLRNLILAA